MKIDKRQIRTVPAQKRTQEPPIDTARKAPFGKLLSGIRTLILLVILGALIWTGSVLADYLVKQARSHPSTQAEGNHATIPWNDSGSDLSQ